MKSFALRSLFNQGSELLLETHRLSPIEFHNFATIYYQGRAKGGGGRTTTRFICAMMLY